MNAPIKLQPHKPPTSELGSQKCDHILTFSNPIKMKKRLEYCVQSSRSYPQSSSQKKDSNPLKYVQGHLLSCIYSTFFVVVVEAPLIFMQGRMQGRTTCPYIVSAPLVDGWYNHTMKPNLTKKYIGIQLTMNPKQPSMTVTDEKTTQQVSHCVASSVVVPLVFDSIDLNDMYAGYKNPNKSVTNLAPPITTVNKDMTMTAAKKK